MCQWSLFTVLGIFDILKKVDILRWREYAILVDNIRKYQKMYADAQEAAILAVDECIENGLLSVEKAAEKMNMSIEQFTQQMENYSRK